MFSNPVESSDAIRLVLPCFCFSNTVLSQQCNNQPNCAGDVVSGPTTAEECCVGTGDGMSFGVSGGTCPVSQCIGNWKMDEYACKVLLYAYI